MVHGKTLESWNLERKERERVKRTVHPADPTTFDVCESQLTTRPNAMTNNKKPYTLYLRHFESESAWNMLPCDCNWDRLFVFDPHFPTQRPHPKCHPLLCVCWLFWRFESEWLDRNKGTWCTRRLIDWYFLPCRLWGVFHPKDKTTWSNRPKECETRETRREEADSNLGRLADLGMSLRLRKFFLC